MADGVHPWHPVALVLSLGTDSGTMRRSATRSTAAFFPVQGSVMLHSVAGKAACLGEALRPEFKIYNQAVLDNARALASAR